MKAMKVATRFFALNCLVDVAVAAALNAVAVSGTFVMKLKLLLLLLTCFKFGDVDKRT